MDPDTQSSIFSVRPKCLQIWCLPSYMIQCWSASLRRADDMCKAEDNFAKFRQITLLGAALQRLCNCDCIRIACQIPNRIKRYGPKRGLACVV